MPAPRDQKKAAALRQVWVEVRRYFYHLMSETKQDKELWQRIEARVEAEIAAQEAAEQKAI